MADVDYRTYYHLESYLFDTVQPRFAEQGFLSAFDFFCIAIWKADRAKSYAARRILAHGYVDLETGVRALTAGIAEQPGARERLYFLLHEWGFLLPTASAILTVLYPNEFTVYDRRICAILGMFEPLGSTSNFTALWKGYQDFRDAVKIKAPAHLSLRDKDRYLWGQSFYTQLEKDIKRGFRSDVMGQV